MGKNRCIDGISVTTGISSSFDVNLSHREVWKTYMHLKKKWCSLMNSGKKKSVPKQKAVQNTKLQEKKISNLDSLMWEIIR